jgi:hypothetical protein
MIKSINKKTINNNKKKQGEDRKRFIKIEELMKRMRKSVINNIKENSKESKNASHNNFSKDKIGGDRRIQITLNNGFAQDANSRQNDRLVYGVSGTFPQGITTVGEVSYLLRHGPYVPLINTAFANGEPVEGITAYLDYNNLSTCYLKVKNSNGTDFTGYIYCIIPIYEY